MKAHGRWYLGLMALCVAFALNGCRGRDKVTVLVKPKFEYQRIQRIAVVGFENGTGNAQVGGVADAVADKLTAILVQNGTYQVVTRDRLRAVLAEQNLSLTSHVDPSTAVKIGKIAAVDTIIAGRLTQFGQDTRNEIRYRDQYDWSTGTPVKTGTIPYQWTRMQVDASASVQMIGTSTGEVIWSDDKSYSSWAEGSPPPWSMGQCQEQCLVNLVVLLANGLVPHVAEVKVPKESIFTCKDFAAGQFMDKTDKFTDRDENVYVVLALTPEFTDTSILLRIVQVNNSQVVFQQEHVWDGKKYGRFGFPYKVADIVQKGGLGSYEAQYFIGGSEIAVVKFRIDKAK